MQLLPDPLERLKALINQKTRTVIGLAGLPGSGKSTVAEQFTRHINHLQPGTMISLSMDGFHLSKAQLRAMPDPEAAFARRGAPWTFDASAFVNKVKALRTAEEIKWPDFQHGSGDPVEDSITIPASCNLVLVEGLYTLYRGDEWAQLENCFDELWYLNVSQEIAMERLLKRHQTASGLSKAEALAKAERNDRLNGLIVEATKIQANFFINN